MTDRHDPEHDDVRRLLSSLPDPGPMPPDLVQRISASLAEEQSRREHAPLGTVHSLDTARERRSLARRLPAVAVAATVVVLAGAAVMGILTGRGFGGSGQDSVSGAEMLTATQMADAGGADAAEDSAGDTAEDPEGGWAADSDDSGDDTAAETGDELAGGADLSTTKAQSEPAATADAAGGPAVTASGTLVTSTTLRDLVVELRSRAPLPESSDARSALERSTVATPADAADCLSGVVPEPAEDLQGRVDVVDVVEFDGALRAVIVLTDDPAHLSGPQEPATAYLVPLDCRADQATLLHEPVRVA